MWPAYPRSNDGAGTRTGRTLTCGGTPTRKTYIRYRTGLQPLRETMPHRPGRQRRRPRQQETNRPCARRHGGRHTHRTGHPPFAGSANETSASTPQGSDPVGGPRYSSDRHAWWVVRTPTTIADRRVCHHSEHQSGGPALPGGPHSSPRDPASTVELRWHVAAPVDRTRSTRQMRMFKTDRCGCYDDWLIAARRSGAWASRFSRGSRA